MTPALPPFRSSELIKHPPLQALQMLIVLRAHRVIHFKTLVGKTTTPIAQCTSSSSWYEYKVRLVPQVSDPSLFGVAFAVALDAVVVVPSFLGIVQECVKISSSSSNAVAERSPDF